MQRKRQPVAQHFDCYASSLHSVGRCRTVAKRKSICIAHLALLWNELHHCCAGQRYGRFSDIMGCVLRSLVVKVHRSLAYKVTLAHLASPGLCQAGGPSGRSGYLPNSSPASCMPSYRKHKVVSAGSSGCQMAFFRGNVSSAEFSRTATLGTSLWASLCG